jgi:hypothetical protein
MLETGGSPKETEKSITLHNAYHDSAAGYFDRLELADRRSISSFRLRHSIYADVAMREIASAVPIGADVSGSSIVSCNTSPRIVTTMATSFMRMLRLVASASCHC